MFALSNSPSSYVLTVHFANLIATYGGAQVRSTMRIFRDLDLDSELDNLVIWDDPIERQLGIMFQSFGKESVCKFYELIYSFEQKKETA